MQTSMGAFLLQIPQDAEGEQGDYHYPQQDVCPFVRTQTALLHIAQGKVEPQRRKERAYHSSAGLYRHAAAKSPDKRLRHIRLTPQPGHKSPVSSWKAQGTAKPVYRIRSAYESPSAASAAVTAARRPSLFL